MEILNRFRLRFSFFFLVSICVFLQTETAIGQDFGFSKIEITPEKPIRLSGYGSRTVPSEGVDEKLFVRAL